MFDILQLNEKLLPELKEIAKKLKIDNYESLKKQDLVYKILDHQALNPEITNPDQLEIENFDIKLLPKTELPANWFGSEVYRLDASYNNKPVVLKLVPFAEAGQTGGEVRVWMKKK